MGSGPGVPSGDVLIRTDGRDTDNLGAFGQIGLTALAGDDTFYFLRGRSEVGYSLMRLRPQDAAPQEVWFSGPSADGYFRLDDPLGLAVHSVRFYDDRTAGNSNLQALRKAGHSAIFDYSPKPAA